MNNTLRRLMLAGVLTGALTLTGCSASGSDVTGTWGDPDVSGQPSLELKSSGEVTGTDGCNRLMGTYELEAGDVVFEPFASTMMFCEGVDTWMLNAATASVSGDTMTFFGADGERIGTLERGEK